MLEMEVREKGRGGVRPPNQAKEVRLCTTLLYKASRRALDQERRIPWLGFEGKEPMILVRSDKQSMETWDSTMISDDSSSCEHHSYQFRWDLIAIRVEFRSVKVAWRSGLTSMVVGAFV
jgi:hypothetical protein